ncbi:MAG: hypothetical protein ACLP4R_26715 [Solirubrobacteraceae bacterium]
MTSVTLDRAQRQTLRYEIYIQAGNCGDISKCLEQPDREFVVRSLEKLQRTVAALDVIGWLDTEDSPNELVVSVDPGLATWAQDAADDLKRGLRDFVPSDDNLEALSALRLIAGGA